MKRLLAPFLACLAPLLSACTGSPEGVAPVTGFTADRYLGTWHEIARLDHRFERGLIAVTAAYSRNPDGSIKVVNRGFDPEKCAWREAVGRAKFMADPATAHLAVSFFGPFYGGYTVFELDKENYAWAAVAGPSRDYLWILARDPALDAAVRDRLIGRARELGFPTEGLILVPQEVPPC
ncbi:MAG: lipocalin family protein [Rhodospirillaceae bacterium]